MFNGMAVVSLTLCVATMLITMTARRHNGTRLAVGAANGRCWMLTAWGSGDFQLLAVGAWPHPAFSIWKLTDGDVAQADSPRFTTILGGAPGAYCRHSGWRAFSLFTGRGSPYLDMWPPDGGRHATAQQPQYTTAVAVPFAFLYLPGWALPTMLSLLPLTMLVVNARHRVAVRIGRRRGLCLSCSYDLTGNVSGVCPECGTVVSKKT
jgi:hypothetical protein